MATRGKSIDINAFNCVKILLKSGATYEEVTNMTGLSTQSIWRIKKAETFEEFQHNRQAAAIGAKAKQRMEKEAEAMMAAQIKKQEAVQEQEDERKEKPIQPPVMQNSYQMNRLIEIIKEQNEILKIMSNKIAFIVDELTK